MTAREQAIMDRWDAGESKRAIAAALDLSTIYVGAIIRAYDFV